MPRVSTSEADGIDFCKKCFPSEAVAEKKYGNLGDGPEKRGNCFEHDVDHPPYAETDYKCTKCNKKLTSNDD